MKIRSLFVIVLFLVAFSINAEYSVSADKKADGQTCSTSSECESYHCSCQGAACPKEICCPSGEVCCLTDSDCGWGDICQDYSCLRKDGTLCTYDSQCASDYCSGVCCEKGNKCCDSSSDCPDGQKCSIAKYYCVEDTSAPPQEPDEPEEPDEGCGDGECGLGEHCSDCSEDCGRCRDLCEATDNWRQCMGAHKRLDGAMRCAESYNDNFCCADSDCGSGKKCTNNNCVATTTTTTKRYVGQNCQSGSDCKSGYCPNGICCTPGKICCRHDIKCKSGYECKSFYCIPKTTTITGTKKLCEVCATTEDCKAGSYCGEFTKTAKKCVKSGVMNWCCSDGYWIDKSTLGTYCCADSQCASGGKCVEHKCIEAKLARLLDSAQQQPKETVQKKESQQPKVYAKEKDYTCNYPSCYADFGKGWKCYNHGDKEGEYYCCGGNIEEVACSQRGKSAQDRIKEELEEYKKKLKEEPKKVVKAKMMLVPDVDEIVLRKGEKFEFSLDGRNTGTVTLSEMIVGAGVVSSAILHSNFIRTMPDSARSVRPAYGVYKLYDEREFEIEGVQAGETTLDVFVRYSYGTNQKKIEKAIAVKVLDEDVRRHAEATDVFDRPMILFKMFNGEIKIWTWKGVKTYKGGVFVRPESTSDWERERMSWIKKANKLNRLVDPMGTITGMFKPDFLGAYEDAKDIVETKMRKRDTPDDYINEVSGKTFKVMFPIGFELAVGLKAMSLKNEAIAQMKDSAFKDVEYGVVDYDVNRYDVMYKIKGGRAYMVILDEREIN